MPKHENISEIDWESALIVEEMNREADILVETLFAVPPGMEKMESTRQATDRLAQLAPEQRRAFFQANPDALDEFMNRNGRTNA